MSLTQEHIDELHEQVKYAKRFGNGLLTISADALETLLPPKSAPVPDQGDTIAQATASTEPPPTTVQ